MSRLFKVLEDKNSDRDTVRTKTYFASVLARNATNLNSG